jgi:hypothetical protein
MKQYFKNIKTLGRMRVQKRLCILEGKNFCMSHILWKKKKKKKKEKCHIQYISSYPCMVHLVCDFTHAHNPIGNLEVCLVQGSVLTKHLEKTWDGFSWDFNDKESYKTIEPLSF